MTRGTDTQFKRDAAPAGRDPLPWVSKHSGSRVATLLDAYGYEVSLAPETIDYIAVAANERPAMLAEIERLRQAVVDACEACARRFDANAAGYRAMQSRLLGERQFLEADDAGKAAEDIEAIAAAIRARSTP